MKDKDSELLAEAYRNIIKEYSSDIHSIIIKEADPLLDAGIPFGELPQKLVDVIHRKHGEYAAQSAIKWMERQGWSGPEGNALSVSVPEETPDMEAPALGGSPSGKYSNRFDIKLGDSPSGGGRLPHESQDDDDEDDLQPT